MIKATYKGVYLSWLIWRVRVRDDKAKACFLEQQPRTHILNHKQEAGRANWEKHKTLKSQRPPLVTYFLQQDHTS